MRREIGRPHAQPLKQPVEARELADVLDRHTVTAWLPFILLGIDRNDQANGSCHIRDPSAPPGEGPPDVPRAASQEPGAQPAGQIEAAEPSAAPTRSKDHELRGGTLRGGPLQLVRPVPAPEGAPMG